MPLSSTERSRKTRERIRANPELHERMKEKDRIAKQIKKENAPELTEEQKIEKRRKEREAKRKQREKKILVCQILFANMTMCV